MIRPSAVVSTVVLGCLGLSGQAMAACTPVAAALTQAQLTTALTGNTVCAVRSAESWQELHQAGGALIDYKRGPAHPVDPSEQVGTWSITASGGNARVVYNYGAGGSFGFRVHAITGTSYSFCSLGATADIDVTIKPGGGPCP